MSCRILKLGAWAGTVVLLAVGWCVEGAQGAPKSKPLPSFTDVKAAVMRHFERLPDYQPGNIISQSEVAPLFAQLKRIGWTVADRKAILERVPQEDDYLIKTLRTASGRKFMQKISPSPGVYDRLERLSKLPRGKRTVQKLMGQGDRGADVIKHFATHPAGKTVGQLMSKPNKGGVNYGKPTGRIYTVTMLLAQLKKSYAAAKKDATGPVAGPARS